MFQQFFFIHISPNKSLNIRTRYKSSIFFLKNIIKIPCLFENYHLSLQRISEKQGENTLGSVGEWLKPPVC